MIRIIAVYGLAVVGAALMLVAQRQPWMNVPVALADDGAGSVRCIADEPVVTWSFRLFCLSAGLVLAAGHLWRRRTSHRKAWVAGILFASLIMYPFAAMTLDPMLSSEASWLHIQHENLVWLGGDLHTSLETGRAARREHVYVVDTPRQVSVIQMPSSQLGAFRFGRLMHWIDMLGYSNRFCQFVGRGWLAALTGALALIGVECIPGGIPSRGRALEAILAASTALAALVAVAVVAVLLSTRALDRARGAIARGLYDVGEARLEEAACYLPSLREDTAFVAQCGLLDHRRGIRTTLVGRLFDANMLERQGQYAQALTSYEELIKDAPPRSAVRREAVRALLREGVHALNGNRTDRAIELLEKVLRAEPCSIKANYTLQVAYLRMGRRADVERLLRELIAIYRCFQMPTKAIVLASGYENCMLAAFREHDTADVVRYSAKARRP